VLLDQPQGALDKQLREQMKYELKQLHDTTRAVLAIADRARRDA
jgi:ABC-type Fe3+/spermidine/putrescine transport system ATPase subunit